MATGWQQNIPGGWAARALQRACLLARQSRALSWVSPWPRSRDWPGPSCLAALPAHSHGMHCSPQAALPSRSGSSFSKAHRVCPLPVGTLPGSVLPQGASFQPRVPAWGQGGSRVPCRPRGLQECPLCSQDRCQPRGAGWRRGAGSLLSRHRLMFLSPFRAGEAGPTDGESWPDCLAGLQSGPGTSWI